MRTAGSLIAYTLAQRPYRDALEFEAARLGIPVIDLLGRLIDRVASLTGSAPLEQVGRLHQLDEAYYQRMDAVNFAVHHDDGTNPERLREADVILTGVSRTSKTPNSMYLAQHYGFKAANVPLVLKVEPPATLFEVSRRKVIGLTVDPHILHSLRTTRAKIMGLGTNTEYTELDSIAAEVAHAAKIFRELRCHVIDVSNKAIEETSSEIALVLRR